ncbi:MAG: DUF3467 domain-containing protein [bacterium]|nr:DUF3467 domain-containing protein [bacterium]
MGEKNEIEVRTFVPKDVVRQYADFVQVNMSPYDITIDFGDIVYLDPKEIEDDEKTVTRPIKLRITLPVPVASQLRDLINDIIRAREEIRGKLQKGEDGGKTDS